MSFQVWLRTRDSRAKLRTAHEGFFFVFFHSVNWWDFKWGLSLAPSRAQCATFFAFNFTWCTEKCKEQHIRVMRCANFMIYDQINVWEGAKTAKRLRWEWKMCGKSLTGIEIVSRWYGKFRWKIEKTNQGDILTNTNFIYLVKIQSLIDSQHLSSISSLTFSAQLISTSCTSQLITKSFASWMAELAFPQTCRLSSAISRFRVSAHRLSLPMFWWVSPSPQSPPAAVSLVFQRLTCGLASSMLLEAQLWQLSMVFSQFSAEPMSSSCYCLAALCHQHSNAMLESPFSRATCEAWPCRRCIWLEEINQCYFH